MLTRLCLLGCLSIASPSVVAQPASDEATFLARAAAADDWDAAEYAKRVYEYESSTVLEVFDADTPEDAPWRDDARAVLDDACKLIARVPDAPAGGDVVERVRTLVESGCTDDLVVFFDHFFRSQRPTDDEFGDAFAQAVTDLVNGRYSYARKVGAIDALARWSIDNGNTRYAQRVYEWGAFRFARIHSGRSAGERFDSFDREYRFTRVRQAMQVRMGPDAIRKVLESLDEMRHTDPWLGAMVRAICAIELAWESRGTSTWGRLTSEQRAGYRRHMDEAIEYAIEAHELEPGLPYAALVLTQIAVEGYDPGDKNARQWFETAVGARFDMKQTYIDYLRGLQTRWGGSVNETRDFALEVAGTDRFDTEIPWQMFDAVAQMGSDLRDFTVAWNDTDLAPEIDRVLRGYDAEPRSPIPPDDVQGMRIAAAWRQGRYDAAYAELRRGDFYRRMQTGHAWYVRAMPEDILMDAFALGGPHRDRVATALVQESPDDVARMFDEIIASCDPEEDTTLRALHDARSRALTQRALLTGEWVDLELNYVRSGWRALAGYWWTDDEQPEERFTPAPHAYTQHYSGHMMLRTADPVGTRYEIECTVDVASMGEHENVQFGLMLDYGADKYDDAWRSVLMRPNRGIATISSDFSTRTDAALPELGETATLRVAKWDEYVAVFVDEELIYKGEIPGDAWQGFGDYAGLGAWAPSGQRIRFWGTRIRMIESPPQELGGVVPGFDPPPSERPRF